MTPYKLAELERLPNLNEDFELDPVELIEQMCKAQETRDNIELYLSSSSTKLQLLLEQINGSFENKCINISQNMPKILRDTQLLTQETNTLKNKIKSVIQELDMVGNTVSPTMQKLIDYDCIKKKLNDLTESMKQADNWTALANEVEEVFAVNDCKAIAEKICSMQKSLAMLTKATDFNDKKLQLEGLKNRLETMATPQLIQAFTSGNLKQSKTYVDIFIKIDRLPQLLKYYHDCQKTILSSEWKKTIELAPEKNIVHWLQIYYDKLLFNWNSQVKFCHQVFPSSGLSELASLLTNLLNNMDPSITDCIDAALKQQSNSTKLSILMQLRQNTCQFADNLASTNGVSMCSKFLELARAIHSPYIGYIAKYSIYETSKLTYYLGTLEFSFNDSSDTINALSLSVSKILEYAKEANERCKLFSEGCAYPGLIKAYNTFFNNYLEKYKIGLKQLNKRKVKHEDWNLFQMCLTLMQTTGEFLRLIDEFEDLLVSNILDTHKKLRNPDNDVFHQYLILILNEHGLKEFESLVSNIQKGNKSVLDPTKRTVRKLCSDSHRLTYEVIFAPIFTQLLLISKSAAWSSALNKTSNPISLDLPDYSFAPQEYITQVGQYLMTLPQHLEPFLLKDNPNLTKALKAADAQYNQELCETAYTNILLGIIAKETCQMFQDQTWGIYELSQTACKQLATDIDYLGNVLEELGHSLSENLQQMAILLRLSPDAYQAGSSGCNPRVVAAVRQMRNITSSG
ncbi:hypothetical protein TKK_0015774 [Trichogramma kaykai]|uniref:Conserved oligomeric Golgi complex subunit 7 n=1 Tax=Trichogramma kaykai TaxID=54128 RepID=A0ABD2W7W7_9HYME